MASYITISMHFWCAPPKTICTVKPVWNGHSKIDKTKILMTNGSLMKVESIAECSPWSILQYFWPALRDNWTWKSICGLFESGHFTQVLLYIFLCQKVIYMNMPISRYTVLEINPNNNNKNIMIFVCWFDLILYIPSTIFQLSREGSSWVEPLLS